MIVVFIIVLVVFGPNKLPELARGLGKLMAEVRKASADFKGAFEQEMRDMERQTMLAERKKAAEAAAAAAAAAPAQPATQATVAGADTAPSEAVDTRATEALVATPVAEAVARGYGDDAAAVSVDTAPVKTEGVSCEVENTNGHGGLGSASEGTASKASPHDPTHDPTHDTQQPA